MVYIIGGYKYHKDGTKLVEKNVFTQLFPTFHLSNWSDK